MTISQPIVDAVGHIVLARLVADPKKTATLSKLSKDLAGLAPGVGTGGASWSEILKTSLDQLTLEGLIQRNKRGNSDLTALGESRALTFLRLDQIPEKTSWATLRDGHIMAVALGLPAPNSDQLKKLLSAPGLKAALLRSKFDLKTPEYSNAAAQAVDALAWKLVGVDSTAKFTRDALLAAFYFHPPVAVHGLFGNESGPAIDPKKAIERIVTKSVGARNAKAPELRNATIRSWIESLAAQDSGSTPVPVSVAPEDHPTQPGSSFDSGSESKSELESQSDRELEVSVAHLDLTTFANHAIEAARNSSTGRFGDNKVFISHAWQAAQQDPLLRGIDLNAFKQRLAEANQARLLTLSRADLVDTMDSRDVQASETHHFGATYHFILIS